MELGTGLATALYGAVGERARFALDDAKRLERDGRAIGVIAATSRKGRDGVVA